MSGVKRIVLVLEKSFFFAAVTIICIGTTKCLYRYLSVDVCTDSVPIVTVSSQVYCDPFVVSDSEEKSDPV